MSNSSNTDEIGTILQKFKNGIYGAEYDATTESEAHKAIEDLLIKARIDQATQSVYAADKGSDTETRLINQLKELQQLTKNGDKV